MPYEPLMTTVATVLAAIESAPGVYTAPNPATDAVAVEEPNYEIDPTVLERNQTAGDMSSFASMNGRVQASVSFAMELKGNGLQKSGLLSDAPVMTRLLRACGYRISSLVGSTCVGEAIYGDANSVNAKAATVWGAATRPTEVDLPVLFTIKVTGAGGSGVAVASIFNSDAEIAGPTQTGVILTSGSAVELGDDPANPGTPIATITPTFTGSFAVGDTWHVFVVPEGIELKPRSKDFETLTIVVYYDGLKHVLTNAVGTFSIAAEAGGLAKINFTFTGQHNEPTDEDAPAGVVYRDEAVAPAQVELSNLTWGGDNNLVVGDWKYDQVNTVNPRMDVNGKDGYRGFRITERKPTGGITPEATLEGQHPFWADLAKARQKHFSTRVGQERGNIVVVELPKAQVSGMPYGDRNGHRTYDLSFACRRFKGDDESRFIFC